MTIYVVMQHSHGAESVPVSAWHFMSTADLDMPERENSDAAVGDTATTYAVVPVNLGGDR